MSSSITRAPAKSAAPKSRSTPPSPKWCAPWLTTSTEKKIQVETGGEPVAIEADEQLLRQVLFNLLLNAIQAVGTERADSDFGAAASAPTEAAA